MQALLVVDIDHFYDWTPEIIEQRPEMQKTAENIKNLLKEAREKKVVISFATWPCGITGQEFQLEMTPSQTCIICDRSEYRLALFLEHRHKEQFEAAFIKNESDAFSNRALAPYFHSKNVTEIMLAGCLTNVCVLKTAQGAIKAGFNVTLIEECSHPQFLSELKKKEWLMGVTNLADSSLQAKIVQLLSILRHK